MWRFIGLIICALGFTSCSTVPLTVNLEASPILNVSADNQALPVLLKIYQLDDDQLFQQASFRELWKYDEQILGPSLLDKQITVVQPGTRQQIKLNLQQQAHYIAVMAIYRKPENNTWQSVKSLAHSYPHLPTKLNLVMQANTIKFE